MRKTQRKNWPSSDESKNEQERQQKEDEDRPGETADRATDADHSFVRQRIGQLYGLDKADLNAVIRVVVDDLPADLKPPEFERPQLNQLTKIIHAHAEWKQDYAHWPDEELLAKMTKVVRPRTTQLIKHSGAWGESSRETMVSLILRGIMKQIDDAVKPTDEEREKLIELLLPEEREKLKRMSPERLKQFLRTKQFEVKGEDAYKKYVEHRDKVIELYERMQVKLPEPLQRIKGRRDKSTSGKG